MKYVAVLGIWLAVAGMVVGCALAWGDDGRTTVLLFGVFAMLFAAFATGSIVEDGTLYGRSRGPRNGAQDEVTRHG